MVFGFIFCRAVIAYRLVSYAEPSLPLSSGTLLVLTKRKEKIGDDPKNSDFLRAKISYGRKLLKGEDILRAKLPHGHQLFKNSSLLGGSVLNHVSKLKFLKKSVTCL